MDKNPQKNKEVQTSSYVAGFALSIALTLGAYFLVQIHVGSGHTTPSDSVIGPLLLGLAVLQLIVQVFFFLHLGAEEGTRWKLGAFLATLGLVLIVVTASVWIMGHLNYNMTPMQINQYMQSQQEGF